MSPCPSNYHQSLVKLRISVITARGCRILQKGYEKESYKGHRSVKWIILSVRGVSLLKNRGERLDHVA